MVGPSNLEVSPNPTPDNSSGGRWDFLKKPIKNVFNRVKGAKEGEMPLREEDNPLLGSEVFNVEGTNVTVSFAKFNPEGKEVLDSTKAVIFFPGWTFRADSPVTKELPKFLSNEFGLTTYSIDTVASKTSPNALKQDAKAARDFIVQKMADVEEVTIFGHSEGGDKAAYLASILEEENPQIKINGLVLASTMGLYRQRFPELAKNFVINNPKVDSQNQNPAVAHLPMSQVLFELAKSLFDDVKATKFRYPKILIDQMKQLIDINDSIKDIKSPVLLLVAKEDPVSQYEKFLPPEEIAKRLAKPNPSKDKTREEMIRNTDAREQYLKEGILPKASNVTILIATKFSGHGAFPAERAQQTAYIVSRIFDRLRRPDSGSPDQKVA